MYFLRHHADERVTTEEKTNSGTFQAMTFTAVMLHLAVSCTSHKNHAFPVPLKNVDGTRQTKTKLENWKRASLKIIGTSGATSPDRKILAKRLIHSDCQFWEPHVRLTVMQAHESASWETCWFKSVEHERHTSPACGARLQMS